MASLVKVVPITGAFCTKLESMLYAGVVNNCVAECNPLVTSGSTGVACRLLLASPRFGVEAEARPC